ncbi:MAG: hypothetical protein ACRC62_00765 [Microcoleus sp.]
MGAGAPPLTINYQLSIDRERGRSHYNYQLSTINYQLSTINYQLSTINYQLFMAAKNWEVNFQ